MKQILSAATALTVTLLVLLTCCTSEPEAKYYQVEPPIDSLTVETPDGNGIITIVMRTWDNALTREEIAEIKAAVHARMEESEYTHDGPQVTSTGPVIEGNEESRIVVFAYGVYSDRVPAPYYSTAGNERSVTASTYQRASEWLLRELKKHS